ncbi:MAG: hypothetical protein K1V94_07555, partial [Duncaniella dubosii]
MKAKQDSLCLFFVQEKGNMRDNEIIFNRYGEKTIRKASEFFSFNILYHKLYTGQSIIHQSDFLVISDYWKVMEIRLVKSNGKDYIEYIGKGDKRYHRLSELNDLLEYNCYSSEEVTVKMIFDALEDNCTRSCVEMRLYDIYNI